MNRWGTYSGIVPRLLSWTTRKNDERGEETGRKRVQGKGSGRREREESGRDAEV